MDVDDLPNNFDIVILGTGLTETIVAAAFSRIGLKVLHLDRNNYYGGSYANFNLQGIEEWKKKNEDLGCNKSTEHKVTEELKELAGDEHHIYSLPCEKAQAHNIQTNFHVREMTAEEKAVVVASKQRKSTRISTPVMLSEFTITVDSSTEESNNDNSNNKTSLSTIPSATASNQPETKNESVDSENTEVATSEQSAEPSGSSDIEDGADVRPVENVEEKKLSEAASVAESVLGEGAEESIKEWTVEAIQEDWRKYCFDLSPKVLYCSGDLVELLIQSDVARYCEFRTVSRVLTLLNGSLQQVPCSRADVFSSKIVSLVEKRLMMKFLQFAADYESHHDEYIDYKDKPFIEFLKHKKLTASVQHFVQHAIAMVNDGESTEEGLKRTQRFLRSLGRYGNTAFLFSLYGSGELPQAFSRLSAVFGGTYCLMMSASHIIADKENKCCGIISTQGKKINCKYLVAEASYLPSSFVHHPDEKRTSRAIYVTDKSISQSKDPELSMLNFICQEETDKPVLVMELPSSACVCPKGLYVVHLIRECGSDDPEKDFAEVKERLFEGGPDKPKIVWSLYFGQEDLSQASMSLEAAGNIFVTSGGGDGCIDMERSVKEAKKIFLEVCPEEEFLPKPPNPEDIIYVDDEEAAVVKGPGEFEVMGDGNNDNQDGKKNENADEKQDVKTDEKAQDKTVVKEDEKTER